MSRRKDYYETIEELEPDYGQPVYEGNEAGQLSIDDAYWIMRNECGYVDLVYWGEACGRDYDEILEYAHGKYIYQDPIIYEMNQDEYEGWMTPEDFLRGNRIKKLQDAIRIHKKTGRFAHEIRFLRQHLPEDIEAEEIHINLGSTWLAGIPGFIAGFVASLLEMKVLPSIVHDDFRGKWNIECKEKGNEVLNTATYGTLSMSAIQIIEHKLNGRPVKVFDQVPRMDRLGTDSVLNKAETLAAQEKAKKIDVAFQDYCHGNKQREDMLKEVYITQYGYGICRFDGSYLKLEDISGKIPLYEHQKDAIAHIFTCRNVLLAHHVGAGKTYEYICGIHELLRMDLVKKAMIVVPNDTLENVHSTYKELFPQDSILLVTPKNGFSAAVREETLKKMATNQYQVIILAYSSFDMITLSKKYAFAKKDAMLRECNARIMTASNYTQKCKLETMFRRMAKSIRKYKEEFPNSETACFDKLGIDLLCVDEAHNYKNISIDYSGTDNIVGMNIRGSKKANNMLEKVEYIHEQHGRVIMATGTSITNSMADLYVLQRYLQPDELKLCNIFHFNDWINTFCEEYHSFEVDVDSKHCRFTTRFSRSHNLPELMSMFSEVCDFYQNDNDELGLPKFNGYRDIVVKKSKDLKEYIDELAERTEAIRSHEVSTREDNLLKITVQGRQAATEIRLVRPDADVKGESKVKSAAQIMAQLYFAYPDNNLIAFSDISTPKEGFNIYDELKEELVTNGVKREDITFIHDADTEAKKAGVEKDFNENRIRILIGSTKKLGTGRNVQSRLRAILHIDVPWKPSDMVQREGRILRQGNTCDEVFIYRLITEASFDAYSYQLLENKQRFISDFLSGSMNTIHRSEGDCAETVLSYSEIKALAIGNEMIKKRVEVSNQLEHARINQRQKKKELASLEERLLKIPDMIRKRQILIGNARLDQLRYKKSKENIDKEERIAVGEELLEALHDNIMQEKDRIFMTYQGFDVILSKLMKPEQMHILLRRNSTLIDTCNQYKVSMKDAKVLGVTQRINYCLDNLAKEQERHEQMIENYKQQAAHARKELDEGNPYEKEIESLMQQLHEIDEGIKEKNNE